MHLTPGLTLEDLLQSQRGCGRPQMTMTSTRLASSGFSENKDLVGGAQSRGPIKPGLDHVGCSPDSYSFTAAMGNK